MPEPKSEQDAQVELLTHLSQRLLEDHLTRPGAVADLAAATAEIMAGDDAATVAASLLARRPRLDHLGVACADVDGARRTWVELLGLSDGGSELVESEGVEVHMLGAGEARVELLEPCKDDGPVAKFLAKRGPGVHHVCLRVDDIEAVLGRLREGGVEILGEAPRPGAGGCQVAFLHPRSTGGVLVELSQPGPA